jgi:FkbM family methyltransferase
VKQLLRQLRAVPLINGVVTTSVRRIFDFTGRRSEFIIKHLPRTGVAETCLPNGRSLRLWSRGDDWLATQLFWRGWPGVDAETLPLFFRFAESAATCYDVGAHVGLYSLVAALANPSARIYAFEPHPTARERLRLNIELNSLRNIECLDSAVGDYVGDAQLFHVASDDVPSSSSLSGEFMSTATSVVGTSVGVTTLDRVTEEKGIIRVDLVKIDTETTEPAVLRGMSSTLERDRPTIFCEVLPGYGVEAELEKILCPLQYRRYLLTDAGPEPVATIRGHPRFRNYLFTRLGEESLRHLVEAG